MTVINPNSVAGINSITVQTGEALSVHKADGTLISTIVTAAGISTFNKVEIKKGTSGGATANSDAPLVVDNSTNSYIQFRSPNNVENGLLFGDNADNNSGTIIYDHSDDALTFGTSDGTEELRIDSAGQIGIGGITPDTWSTGRAITIGTSQATLWGVGDQVNLSGNAYFNSSWKAAATKAGASQIQQALGQIDLRVTGSVTADAAITWIDALRVTNTGQTKLNIASNGALTEPLVLRNSGTGAGTNVGMVFSNGDESSTGAGALARIKAIDVDNFDSDLVFETGLKSGFSNTTIERLRITSVGDVGIGTDTMNAPLTVVNNDNAGYIASFRQKHASNSAQIIIDSPSDSNVRPSSIDLAQAGTVKWSLGQAYASSSSQAFHIATSALQANENGSKLTITTAGAIGISSVIPTSGFLLDVGGDVTIGEPKGNGNSFIDQKEDGDLHIINSGRTANGASGSPGTAGVGINRFNTRAGGTSLFRDFCVYNGKDTKVLVVDGSASAVGIGTDAPDGAVTIAHSGSSTDFLMFNRPGSVGTFARMGHNTSSGTNMLDIRSEGHTRLLTNGNNETMRITNGNDVIIGGTTIGATGSFGVQSSGAFRSVLAATTASDTLLGAISGVSNGFQINITDANAQTYKFHNGSQQSMTLNSSGQLLVGTTSSSYKFHVDSTNLAAEISIDNDASDHKVALNTTNSVNADFNIQHKANLTSIGTGVNVPLYFHVDGGTNAGNQSGEDKRVMSLHSDGLRPITNNSKDLGSESLRWRNVFTTDLQLSNKGKVNDVDGTWGDYTIQEGENDLFLLNRRNGKKFKFNLTEVV